MSGIVGSKLNIRGSGRVAKLGTDGQVLTSSGAGAGAVFEAAAGGGKIGGVWHTVKTDTFSNSTASTWVDITGLTVTTGTLASSSSKILVSVGIIGASNAYDTWKVVDGSGNDITNFIGDASASLIRCSGPNMYIKDSGDWENYALLGTPGLMLDSPGVTTAQTYKVQTYGYNTTAFYLNRPTSDSWLRSVSSITAMEILA